MRVQVRLFAAARQAVGRDAVQLELAEGTTVGQLREELATHVPQLAGLLPHMVFAVDANYVPDNTVLTFGADIACIPPVSGG